MQVDRDVAVVGRLAGDEVEAHFICDFADARRAGRCVCLVSTSRADA